LPLEDLLVAVDLLRGGHVVVVAEDAEERRVHLGRVVDGGDGALGDELGRVVGEDEATPAIDTGVDGQLADRHESMAAAGAEADGADLAVGIRLGAKEVDAAVDVAHDLGIDHAAFGAALGGGVVVAHTGLHLAVEEVGADGGVTVLGELATDLARPLVPAGHVVDDDDAGEGAGAEGASVVGGDVVSLVAFDGDGFSEHSFVVHGCSSSRGDGLLARGNIPRGTSGRQTCRLAGAFGVQTGRGSGR
jgi:hypothetical protein